MPTALAGQTRRSWGACALVLALCACGGGDGEPAQGGGGPGGDTTGAAAPQATAAVAAADSCTTPPPAYADDLLTGPWSALVARLVADGVTFPQIAGNDTTARMKLCPGCDAVAVRMHSSHLTPCLGTEHLTGAPRILSMFTVQDAVPAQHGWEALSAGDTVFVFATAPSAPAVLVHNSSGTARKAPADAMQFTHCNDGHTATQPQIRWRTAANASETGSGKGKGNEEIPIGCGNAACKSGCCLVCCCPGPSCPRP